MTTIDPVQQGRRGAGLWAIAGALLCIALYFPALGGPLFFDDLPNLVDNTLLQVDWRSFDQWRAAALSSSAGELARFIPMLTFAFNYALSGDIDPFAVKATNLLIHLGCAWLVFLLATAVQRSPAVADKSTAVNVQAFALLAALLWLLHPLHVSTVMYGVQRMAQLSTLFTLMGLVVFLRYRLRWAYESAQPDDVAAAVLWVALLGLFALFSKENGILLPWLIVVLEVTLMRGRWAGQHSSALHRVSWILLVAPVFLLLAFSFALPELLLQRYSGREFTLEERVLTQARVLWHYIGWLVTPHVTNLGFFHDDIALSRGLFSPLTTLFSIVGWIGVFASSLALRRRIPLFAFAVMFFLVGHALESTVVPLEMAFEHRNYLPSIGLVMFASYLLLAVGARLGTQYSPMPAVLVILALSVMLGIRSYAWRDDLSLARFNVVNHAESPRANFYYANALYARYQEALRNNSAEEERAALAVGAREYYLAMHALDPRDLAALVMLYQLDARHFPRLAVENQWLEKIETVAASRRLQRSDITALGALVNHTLQTGGESDRPRVQVMLEALQLRRPGSLGLLALYFRLQLAGGDTDRLALQRALERFVERKPHSRKAVAYLAQFYGGDNLPETYRAVGQWLANDVKRLEIREIHAVFQP